MDSENINADYFDDANQSQVRNRADRDKFLAYIKKIEKIRGVSEKAEANWRFTFEVAGKVEIIAISNSQLMAGHGAFENLFKSRFGLFLPYLLIKKPETKEQQPPWRKFLTWIEERCTEINPTESTEWIECDILMDKISKLSQTNDDAAWANKTNVKQTLLYTTMKGVEYYCLKSNDVFDIVNELRIKTTIVDIGKVMDARKFKRPRNPAIRIRNTKKTVNPTWWFPKKVLEKYGLIPATTNSKINPVQTQNNTYTPVKIQGGY